jgi:hypothetical protein
MMTADIDPKQVDELISAIQTYFSGQEAFPIRVKVFTTQNTQNNRPYKTAMGR